VDLFVRAFDAVVAHVDEKRTALLAGEGG